MLFSQNLDFLLRNNEITQTKLAQKLGKTKATVSDYVLGRSKPTFDGLIILAKMFNISLDDLVFANLEEKKYNIIEEPSEKYHTSKKNSHGNNCYLTNGECFFRTKDEMEKELQQLRARVAELEGKKY